MELGSDQTSCHNPFNGGYYPVDYGYDEAQVVLKEDPQLFKTKVEVSLRRHVAAINKVGQGTFKLFSLIAFKKAGSMEPKI